jgi:hypothetical protein
MVFLHSSEREPGIARAGLKALLLPKGVASSTNPGARNAEPLRFPKPRRQPPLSLLSGPSPNGGRSASFGGSHNSGKSWKTVDFYGLVTVAEICYHHGVSFNLTVSPPDKCLV